MLPRGFREVSYPDTFKPIADIYRIYRDGNRESRYVVMLATTSEVLYDCSDMYQARRFCLRDAEKMVR